jgi:hypothetical protein
MGGGDRLDDRQAESEPVVVAGPVGDEPLEGLEQAVELVWGHVGSGVGHLEAALTSSGVDQDFNVAAGVIVVQGVVEQVRHEAFDKVGLARNDGGMDRHVEAHVPGGGGWLAGVSYFLGNDRQVEGLAPVEASLAAGKSQQRLDQLFLLLAGFEHV